MVSINEKTALIQNKKTLSLILAGILATSSMTALSLPAKADETQNYQLADNIQDGTILHCFSWKYNDITNELPNIAKAGFTSIQVAPAQNMFYEYYPWYIVYQPYGLQFYDPGDNSSENGSYFDLNSGMPSQFNTRSDLTTLCSEAEKYGIKIIMDVVSNHLTRDYLANIGDELAKDEYWHEPKAITNYNRRSNITNGSLSGLTDLNTENEYVQQLALGYINDLKSMGVDGIRWDAAKHIALPSEGSDFWKVVTDTGLYNYGEILNGPVDNKDHDELMAEYAEYMSVTDSAYGDNVSMAFLYKQVPKSDGNWTSRGVNANKLVYWGESHDTYSNGHPGSCDASQNVIDRAYAVVAARADATSLYFSRPGSTEKSEIFEGEKGSTHFIEPEVSAVNHFHNAMIGKKDCYASSNNCAVVTRENGGAVIVCGDETGEVTVENAGGYAVPGTYIDEVSGNSFVVTKETITGTVGETGIAVIYDSPYIGNLYVSPVKSNTFSDEINLTLGSVSAENTWYSLTQKTNGHTVSVETNDFANRDTITIGKDVNEKSEFSLKLNGKSVNGKTLQETFDFYLDPHYRVLPENSKKSTYITFDNINHNFSDVYIYISSNDVGKNITNAEFPGEKMTDSGNKYFTYQIPEKFENCMTFNVTFSDASGNTISQYNNRPLIMTYQSYGIMQDSEWITNYLGLSGDFNNDGKISSKDSLEILRKAINPSKTDRIKLMLGDINMDGSITAKDAMYVLRYTINYSDKMFIGDIISL